MKRYKTIRLVSNILLTGFVVVFVACTAQPAVPEHSKVTFEHLSSDPEKYDSVDIEIEGYFFEGFETIVLSERLVPSGFAKGHVIPEGMMIWIEGGIPSEIHEELIRQEMMGPIERYGKVRMSGIFEHGGEYGHLGQFKYRLTPSEVELLD